MSSRVEFRQSSLGLVVWVELGRVEAVRFSYVLSRWVWSGSGSRVELSQVKSGFGLARCVRSSQVPAVKFCRV